MFLGFVFAANSRFEPRIGFGFSLSIGSKFNLAENYETALRVSRF
jgi:hypothetical protein